MALEPSTDDENKILEERDVKDILEVIFGSRHPVVVTVR
jgi:hypothetical protein